MVELPEAFKARMKTLLRNDAEEFFECYNYPPYKAIRVNTLKISVEEFKKISPFALRPVPWEESGFYVAAEAAGKTIEHAAGLYYVQEPSAMSAAPLLKVNAGERVLDMCSAPGGKGTQLAQKMHGQGIIILNEINFSRAKIVSQNVERLGITNAAVVCARPDAVARHFDGYFDKVLVDAPCSGEGMFRKDNVAIGEWSKEAVLACAKRQAEILESAYAALKRGGLMVYSTCTFAPEEDEGQIESFLRLHADAELLEMKKLLPHECEGEGHFVASIRKNEGTTGDARPFRAMVGDKKAIAAYGNFEKEYLRGCSFNNLHVAGDAIYSLPEGLPELPFQVLRAGVRVADIKKDRVEPAHSLAMCVKPIDGERLTLDESQALSYLGGKAVECSEALKGWVLATYNGYPLGWAKAVDGVAKNHLPKGLRI